MSTLFDAISAVLDGTALSGMTPLGGFLLSALESLIPPIPLTAIVSLNVAAFGGKQGFLVSWAGTCIGSVVVFLFFSILGNTSLVRRFLSGGHISKAVRIVGEIDERALFLIIMLPFTPSAFVNFAFGFSKYPRKKFLRVLIPAKAVMVGSLTAVGKSLVSAFENPAYVLLTAAILVALIALSRKMNQKHSL